MGEIHRIFIRYATHLGIRHTSDARSNGTVLWDGQRMWTCGLDAEEIAHEIAHWIVAGPSMRDKPNFGLGEDHRGGVTPTLVETVETVEMAASALGLALFGAAGGNWEEHAEDHGWYGWNWDGVRTFDHREWSASIGAHVQAVDGSQRWLKSQKHALVQVR